MTRPVDLAVKVHQCVPLFREHHAQVAAHAAHLKSGHLMQLEPTALSHEVPATSDTTMAGAPAEFSDRLLGALFGSWPPIPSGTQPRQVRRRPAVSVREVTWQDWEAVIHQSSRC